MSIPDFQSLLRPVLQLFAEGKTSIKECIDPLKERLGITEEEAQETLQSGQTVLYNRAHWARTYLGKAGMLDSPKRGTHVITDRGRVFLKTAPERITIGDLREFDEFLDWKRQGIELEGADQKLADKLDDTSSSTPEDSIPHYSPEGSARPLQAPELR